jgi:Bacterial self-protective colicin-like immunity
MAIDDVPTAKILAKYKALIYQFINHQISAPDFESPCLKMLKNETEMIGGDNFDILEDLFTSTDDYVADPELRSRLLVDNVDIHKYGKPLDDEELRAEAREAYRKLFGD